MAISTSLFVRCFFLFLLLTGTVVAQNDTVLILEHVRYFDGKKLAETPELHIRNGRITSLRPVQTSGPVRRMSVQGKYVIPGLADAHVHISGSPAFPFVFVQPLLNLNSSLLCGVTTNVDLFSPEAQMSVLRDAAAASAARYSRVLTAGPILTAPGGHGTEYGVPTRTITSVDEARRFTEEVIASGADLLKVCYEAETHPEHSLTEEMVRMIVKTAHGKGEKVVVHINSAREALDCIRAGVDGLAHIPVDALTDADIATIKKSGAFVIPTMVVYTSIFDGHTTDYMTDSLLWRTAQPDYLEKFGREATRPIPLPESYFSRFLKEHPPAFRENLRKLIAAGVPILAGTDAGNYAVFYGYSLLRELEQYCAAGMTPAAALHSASGALTLLFPELRTGRIAPEYEADLVVLNSNPLENIAAVRDIAFVLHKGERAQKIEQESPATVTATTFDPAVFDFDGRSVPPASVGVYSDSMMGGASRISIASVQKDGRATDRYITARGSVTMKGMMGFAGVQISLGDDKPVDLTAYDGITFDVRGNGEAYMFKLVSNLVKDYNYHAKEFKTTGEWQTIKIPFSALSQNPYWGKKIALSLNTIVYVAFEAGNRDYKNVSFDLDNIRFYKN
jgi:imidazolonepropionase-like amidohydrolase